MPRRLSTNLPGLIIAEQGMDHDRAQNKDLGIQHQASSVGFLVGGSGLTSENVQNALTEIKEIIDSLSLDGGTLDHRNLTHRNELDGSNLPPHEALAISYDNDNSELNGENVQDAIDDLAFEMVEHDHDERYSLIAHNHDGQLHAHNNFDTLQEIPAVGLSSTGQVIRKNSSNSFSYEWLPYDISGSVSIKPTAGMELQRFVFTRTVDIVANFSGSQAKCGVAPEAERTFIIRKNGSSVGEFTFAAAATSASFGTSAAVTFTPGDILTVIAPDPQDSTMEKIGWTLHGRLA